MGLQLIKYFLCSRAIMKKTKGQVNRRGICVIHKSHKGIQN